MVILNSQLIGEVSTSKGQVHPRKCISAHSVKIVWGSESYYPEVFVHMDVNMVSSLYMRNIPKI
jgi:hypothetical protein